MSSKKKLPILLSLALLLNLVSYQARAADPNDWITPLLKKVFQSATKGPDMPLGPVLRLETGQHISIVNALSADAKGRFLATVSEDKTLRLWELATGKLARTVRLPVGQGWDGDLYSVALSPDGSTIACSGWTQYNNGGDAIWASDFTIYFVNSANGRVTGRITGLRSPVMALCFSPDGNYLAAGLGGSSGLHVYNAKDLSRLAVDDLYDGICQSVDFSKDNRLVSTGSDGSIRLYRVTEKGTRHLATIHNPTGGKAVTARFSPDGSKVAVGNGENGAVSVLTGKDLDRWFAPNSPWSGTTKLGHVAWSPDGQYLYAAGSLQVEVRGEKRFRFAIRKWPGEGRGKFTDIPVGDTSMLGITSLPDGRIAYCSMGLGVIDPRGSKSLTIEPVAADYRGLLDQFRISEDGSQVQFSYQQGNGFAVFDIKSRKLTLRDEPQADLNPPLTKVNGLDIRSWEDNVRPTLNGAPLVISKGGMSRCLCINPEDGSFLLGGGYSLHRFDFQGKEIWKLRTSGEVWSVNISGDGRWAVAALGDGTIRWYRLKDGQEKLALFPHNDRNRWVLWTSNGFFDHSLGGEELVGFQLNRGKETAADFIPVSKLYGKLYRPDLVAAVFDGTDISKYAKAVDINTILTATTLPPHVELISKSGTSKGVETKIKAEVCDGGGGIGDVTIYLNNLPITVENDGHGFDGVVPRQDTTCYALSRTLSLNDGANTISIMAYNKENTIESERASIIVNHASTLTSKPDLYILTIAVDNYRDGDLRLKYSNADAAAVAETLQAQGKGLFRNIKHISLSDAQVTRNKLETTFAEIGRGTTRQDMFILFLAGHGVSYDKDGSFYFLPADFRYSQDEDFVTQGVSIKDFRRYLGQINATKSLLLLDTCNSGSFVEGMATRGILEKTAINKLTRSIGRHTIVASSKSQLALEGYQGHGAFSWVLIEGLKGKAANPKGLITANTLASFVESTLPELTMKKWGYEQRPQKDLSGEDFAIGAK